MRMMAASAKASAPGPLGSTEPRDKLVLDHVPLVRSMAQRLAQRLPSQVEVSELVSVGVLGLIEAASRYQPTLGVPFDAFALRRVHGAMLDSLREVDWAPRSLRRLRRQLDAAIGNLRRTLGREPEEREIAEAMSLSMAEYERVVEDLKVLSVAALRSLDAGEDGESRLELCVDPGDGVVTQMERQELREHLKRAIAQLPARERQILALSYEEELTLAEIGRVIGVGESRVSQLRTLALSRLRTLLRQSLGLEGGGQ